MADQVYRVKADVSLQQAVARGEEGEEVVQGVVYGAGEYVYADQLSQRDRERAEGGELEHVLEPASAQEAEEAAQGTLDRWPPEHEAERQVFRSEGRWVPEQDEGGKEELKVGSPDPGVEGPVEGVFPRRKAGQAPNRDSGLKVEEVQGERQGPQAARPQSPFLTARTSREGQTSAETEGQVKQTLGSQPTRGQKTGRGKGEQQ